MDKDPFRHRFIVRLHDTDAAGRLFFGHLFRHIQDALESFMDHLGWPIHEMVRAGGSLLPVVHAEADYKRPLYHGERIAIEVWVEEIRHRSFALGYRCVKEGGEEAATARTVHVWVAASGETEPSLPAALQEALASRLRAGR